MKLGLLVATATVLLAAFAEAGIQDSTVQVCFIKRDSDVAGAKELDRECGNLRGTKDARLESVATKIAGSLDQKLGGPFCLKNINKTSKVLLSLKDNEGVLANLGEFRMAPTFFLYNGNSCSVWIQGDNKYGQMNFTIDLARSITVKNFVEELVERLSEDGGFTSQSQKQIVDETLALSRSK